MSISAFQPPCHDGAAPAALPVVERGRLYWGCHDTPLGPILIGVTAEGLCRLEFTSGFGLQYDLAQWAAASSELELVPSAIATNALACRFCEISGSQWGRAQLALYGTEFQLKVWKAMLKVPPGQVMSYEEVARLVPKPRPTASAAPSPGSPFSQLTELQRVAR